MFAPAPQSRRVSVSVWVVPAGCDLPGLPDHPAPEQEFIPERPQPAPTITARSAPTHLLFPNVPDTMGQNQFLTVVVPLRTKCGRTILGKK